MDHFRIAQLEEALREWRDARQAIFDVQHDPKHPRIDLWERLGKAEQRLMGLANAA